MLHIAIVGSGPAGYYTAEAVQKAFGDGVRIDILDRLPTPFGLIRSGVAPDHQSLKAVSKRYEKTALTEEVRFIGNLEVGEGGVSITELLSLYDGVILATGAPADRDLPIPGADLPGVLGSARFVGWYNGHPDFAGLEPPLGGETAIVVGNGNVAIDCARILAKTEEELANSDIAEHAAELLADSRIRTIRILGRRGPHQVSFTPKELGEMGRLERARAVADPVDFPPESADEELDPGLRKVVGFLREFAAGEAEGEGADKPLTVHFDFFTRPVELLGEDRLEEVTLERTRLDENGRAEGTGEFERVPCGLLVSAIGYRTTPIDGVPYDERAGRFDNEDGRISPGLYCVGWARRGPTGTIGTNKPDGYHIADLLQADLTPSGKAGRDGLDRLVEERGYDIVRFTEWQNIDSAEVARARVGAPREKFVHIDDMLDAARTGSPSEPSA
ncbi:pyridine nucleotide-disulfide oxidoreductase [Pacificimonas flava]|uniref:Pyridine nucleotide-disulfide oxidoreductase n=2 Tax=Pacificimonas TaxID=1960290 RepID=A0A219B939_9SPHN|nr:MULTISPECIES: FAD-dependent oxidoreductase [Pacificimonas]MBZ6378364.1 FAD-dependent oxidoreductase [Pacificimonas aurantium]OWV34329.1 pyridine nucleotide-disulfide oxidoreductase [Pacificimonas flava]